MKIGVFITVMMIAFSLALTPVDAVVLHETTHEESIPPLFGEYRIRAGRMLPAEINLCDEEFNLALYNQLQHIDMEASPSFNLPASLQIIEDEAFEGTAIVRANLPESVKSIGVKAFANIPSLRSVRISEHTERIDQTAFSGSGNVMIIAAPGSYARTWAKENGIPLIQAMDFCADTHNVVRLTGNIDQFKRIDADQMQSDQGNRTDLPWRSIDEIQMDQFDQWMRVQIQGRSPPSESFSIS